MELAQLALGGIANGCIYGLVALGFVLIYKATEGINFAQGDLMMLGAFITLTMVNEAWLGLPFWLGVLVAIVVMGGMGSQVGVVIAAIVMIGLPEWFRELQEYRMLFFGAGMVLIMVWRPRGLLSRRNPTIRLHTSKARAAP